MLIASFQASAAKVEDVHGDCSLCLDRHYSPFPQGWVFVLQQLLHRDSSSIPHPVQILFLLFLAVFCVILFKRSMLKIVVLVIFYCCAFFFSFIWKSPPPFFFIPSAGSYAPYIGEKLEVKENPNRVPASTLLVVLVAIPIIFFCVVPTFVKFVRSFVSAALKLPANASKLLR